MSNVPEWVKTAKPGAGVLWREVKGYEGLYDVSSDGKVYSRRSKKVLRGSPIPGGYLTVALHAGGGQKTRTIHRLVCEAFHRNPHGKPTVNHIDGVKTNNRASNLEWATHKENTANGVERGTITGVPRKLDEPTRDEIRTLYRGGQTMRGIAALHGVTHKTVSNIVKERPHQRIEENA